MPDEENWELGASLRSSTLLKKQGVASVNIQWKPTHQPRAGSKSDVNNGRIESFGCVGDVSYGQQKQFGVTHITPGDPTMTTEAVLERHVEKLKSTTEVQANPRLSFGMVTTASGESQIRPRSAIQDAQYPELHTWRRSTQAIYASNMYAETSEIVSVFCDRHSITCNVTNSDDRKEMVKELSDLLHHRNNESPETIRSRSLIESIWNLLMKSATKGDKRYERRCERYRIVAADWVRVLRAANPAVEIPTTLGLTVRPDGSKEWTAKVTGKTTDSTLELM